MIEVTLWDEKVRLNTNLDDDFVLDIADYMNGVMAEVMQDKTLITTKYIALRATFMIATDYMILRKKIEELEAVLGGAESSVKFED